MGFPAVGALAAWVAAIHSWRTARSRIPPGPRRGRFLRHGCRGHGLGLSFLPKPRKLRERRRVRRLLAIPRRDPPEALIRAASCPGNRALKEIRRHRTF